MAHSSLKSAAKSKYQAVRLRRGTAAVGSPPRVCLLSNGRYSVVLTETGSGYSSCDGRDLTRWREDTTRDCWGQVLLHPRP